MKLYSRRQLTGAIVTVSLLAAAAAFGFGYIAFRPQASQDSASAWLGDQGSVQSAVTAESMPAPVDGAVAGTINDGTSATQSLQPRTTCGLWTELQSR